MQLYFANYSQLDINVTSMVKTVYGRQVKIIQQPRGVKVYHVSSNIFDVIIHKMYSVVFQHNPLRRDV